MINEVIVVEGKNDKARILAIYPDLEVVTTNGSEISNDTILLIEKLSKTHRIILFLDPDYPGERIRSRILERVPNCDNVFIEKKKAIDSHKHKVGVEHASRDAIIAALNNKLTYKETKVMFTMNDLYKLGLTGSNKSVQKRAYLSMRLHLGFPNAKTLLKRLNILGLEYKEVSDILNEKDWYN